MGRNPLVRAHLDRICTFKQRISEAKSHICPQSTGYFWRVVEGQTEVIPAPCKRYDCPHCGPIKRNILLDKIHCGTIRIASDSTLPQSYRMIRLLTLTQHPDDPTNIMEAYNRFRLNLARDGFRKIRYFWVKEFTRKGKLHLHILVNRFIPQAVIMSCWKRATDGWSHIVHIQRVSFTLRSPAGYMSKYITKSTTTGTFRKKEHRYGHDHDTDWTAYTEWKPNGTTKWQYERHEIWKSSSMMARAGEEEAAADRGGGQSPVGGGSPLPAPPPGAGRSEQT